MKKRLISLFLAMVMLFSVLPVGAVAAEADETEVVVTESAAALAEEPPEPETSEECSHAYAETVVTAPTCTAVGKVTYTCSLCEDTYDEEIPMLDHTWVAADCETPKTCSVCGATEGQALGHDFVQGDCTRCDAVKTWLPASALTAENVAATGRIKLSWKAVDGASAYNVYRSDAKNGEYALLTTTSETGMEDASAVAGKTYYYYVAAVAADGTECDPSEVVQRTCDLAQPVITVANDAATGKPQVTWKAVEGAVKYRVYRATEKNGEYVNVFTTANTSYKNTSAEPGVTYYYKVKAISSNNGANSVYSAIKSRTCNLAQPVVTATNDAASGKPQITWKAVEGAVKYRVYRAAEKNGEYKNVYTTANTSYKNTSAKVGETWYYKVKAVAENTNADSVESAVKSRTCNLAQPVVTLSNVVSSGKNKLDWEAIDGAVKYRVYRATEKNGEYKNVYTTEGTTYTNTSAEAGVKYYYKVKAIAADETDNSAYSVIKSRTCNLPRPTDLAITLTKYGKPILTWSAVEGAVRYEVYRSDDGGTTYKRVYATENTTYTNTGAEASTTYSYKVRAIAENTDANSAFSAVKSKKTSAGLKMKVNNGPLNVRTGAGADFTVVKSLSNKAIVYIDRISNGWGQTADGWVSMNYVIEVVDTSGSYDYTMATYTTSAGSSTNRDTNLRVACKAINGTILMPGESFSFNEVVGRRTASRGYKKATVILNGEYSTSYGGGVCQVSSTVFNAALLSNLKIDERRQHSLSVAYLPKGRDAMVSWGTSDFCFTNNSKYCIKISASASYGTVTISFKTRESGTKPNVNLNVTRSGNTYTLTRSYKGSVNYRTWSTY